ncbi:MAG: BMP family ABC transporter substrate-binding protein [Ruminiclostridium sp.]|nr:BMP family ABC transporter substrate-binding protein [Ruminiclostridium sp.]
MKRGSSDALWSFRLIYIAAAAVMMLGVLAVILSAVIKDDSSLKVGCVLIGCAQGDSERIDENVAGMKKACENTQTPLLIKENIAADTADCEKAARELIAEGCRVIMLPCRGSGDIVRTFADKYRNITFCLSAAGSSSENIVYCCGRIYQGRYLCGMVAGQTTLTKVVGYVAAMPCPEVYRSVNAFVLGVKSADPEVTVKVTFSGEWDNEQLEREAVKRLASMNADVIAYQQDGNNAADACEELGIDYVCSRVIPEPHTEHLLVSSTCDWENIYGKVIRDGISGKCSEHGTYWLGLNEGGIFMSELSPNVRIPAATAYEKARAELLSGPDVFSGVIWDRDGTLRCGLGEVISDEVLLSGMNWLIEGAEIDE